jgi:hypothetical protein
MAFCLSCGAKMGTTAACSRTTLHFGPYTDERVRFGDESHRGGGAPNCARCGVERGAAHHSGCPAEECPNCGRALIHCWCADVW